ncbi:MAG: hypothetical protein ACE5EM_08575 [Sphingomonadales bacterium]
MRQGIFISAFLHIAAITLVITGIPLGDPERLEMAEIIPVEILDIEELSSAPKPEPLQAALEPEPVAPKPKPQRRVETSPDEAPAVPLPPEIETPRAKPKPPPRRQTATLAPRVKPRPPKRYDPDRLSALLDKRRASKEVEAPDPDPAGKKASADSDIRSRLTGIERKRLTVGIQDAMRSQIEHCWTIPAGARNSHNLAVRIRVFLNPDGSLARPPEIVDQQRMYAKGQEFFRAAAESARRAVQKCAPLDLPVEHYQIWRDSELSFDPSRTLDG